MDKTMASGNRQNSFAFIFTRVTTQSTFESNLAVMLVLYYHSTPMKFEIATTGKTFDQLTFLSLPDAAKIRRLLSSRAYQYRLVFESAKKQAMICQLTLIEVYFDEDLHSQQKRIAVIRLQRPLVTCCG